MNLNINQLILLNYMNQKITLYHFFNSMDNRNKRLRDITKELGRSNAFYADISRAIDDNDFTDKEIKERFK